MKSIMNATWMFFINLFVLTIANRDMGPGLWMINNVKNCEDHDVSEIQADVERIKMNRTLDTFNAKMVFPEELDCTFGLLIEIYKLCDGGYKHQQTVKDDCACKFAEENVNDNFIQATGLAGIPSECPFPLGIHTIEGFIMNYLELPEQCVYGEFKADVHLIKDDKVAFCITLYLECQEKEQEASGP